MTDYEGVAAALVRDLKFGRVYAAARPLAVAMADVPLLAVQGAVLVPTPTANSRVRQRGYDQAQLLAKHLSNVSGRQWASLLGRRGNQRQTGTTRRERLRQLEQVFYVKKRSDLPKEVVLVDDVLTTGSTLEAAARTLRAAGVRRVSAVVFARAVPE